MKDVLAYIVEHLVDHSKDVRIEEATVDSRTTLTIHVHPEDMGKIIGKSGRIIKALRDLMKVAATKKNVFIDIVLAEEERKSEETST